METIFILLGTSLFLSTIVFIVENLDDLRIVMEEHSKHHVIMATMLVFLFYWAVGFGSVLLIYKLISALAPNYVSF